MESANSIMHYNVHCEYLDNALNLQVLRVTELFSAEVSLSSICIW